MDSSSKLESEDPVSPTIASFGIALGVTSVLNALIVMAKEKSPTVVMAWMARATGHHWITQSIAVLVLFFGLGFGLPKVAGGSMARLTSRGVVRMAACGVAAGALLIVGFYLLAD